MSLSHFHMNDKQIKAANSHALAAAMGTVLNRYEGDPKATDAFIKIALELLPDAGGVQTGAARFNWQGKRGAALSTLLEKASNRKLNLRNLAEAEGLTRLYGILRSVEAHTPNGRKNIAKHVSIDEKQLAFNMEVFSMTTYFNKLSSECNRKLLLAKNEHAHQLAAEYLELFQKMQRGIAKPEDVKKFVTVSRAVEIVEPEYFSLEPKDIEQAPCHTFSLAAEDR